MNGLPQHIVVEMNRLIDEGKPVEEIAFMMRLSRETVEAAKRQRVNTTPAKVATR
jgi:DNA-binding NarL/FixJ family response regulator